jgi:hypothetical protein
VAIGHVFGGVGENVAKVILRVDLAQTRLVGVLGAGRDLDFQGQGGKVAASNKGPGL